MYNVTIQTVMREEPRGPIKTVNWAQSRDI